MTTKRKNRIAWGLALLLAVLVLGGSWIGIRRTYGFVIFDRPGHTVLGSLPSTGGDMHIVLMGDRVLLWWHRKH
jgi:hypothetical protein